MPPKASPLKNRKVLIIAAVALLVVGYLFLRSTKGSPAAQTPSGSGATPGTIPQTGADPGTSGTDQSSADLLAALAGDNQQLMKSFLASSSGLVSLAGSSFGAPGGSSTGAGEPSGTSGFASTTSQPFDTSTFSPDDLSANPNVSALASGNTISNPAPFIDSALAESIAAAASNPNAGNTPQSAYAQVESATAQYGVNAPFGDPTLTSQIAGAVDAAAGSEGWGGSFSGGTQPTPSVTVTQSKPGSGNLAA